MRTDSIDGSEQGIEFSNTVKYLGVTLDESLCWKPHIEDKISACKKLMITVNSKLIDMQAPKPKLPKWTNTRMVRPKLLFCKGALFRGKGGPPVLEKPARHLPHQGRGFVRPPVQILLIEVVYCMQLGKNNIKVSYLIFGLK